MKSRSETSAGGAIFRKINGGIEILLLKDRKNKWTFPKGLIETSEDPILTAQREIKEEVGVDKVKYKGSLGTVNYIFTFKKEVIYKTVHYYLFELVGNPNLVPQKEEGIQEVQFVSLDKAESIIGYKKTNAPILKKIKEFFQKNA